MNKNGTELVKVIGSGDGNFPLCTNRKVIGVPLNLSPGEEIYRIILPGGRVEQTITLPVQAVDYRLIN